MLTRIFFLTAFLACTQFGFSQTVVTTASDENDTVATDGLGISLREAIRDSASGEVITFDPSLAGSSIILTEGTLSLNKNITINGLGADQLSISGNNEARIFTVAGTRTITINDVSLIDGNASNESRPASGVLFAVGGTITFNRVLMQNNTARTTTSVMEVAFAELNINDSAIINNPAVGIVGTLRLQDSRTTITNTTISGNGSRALSINAAAGNTDTLSLTNVTVTDNAGSVVEVIITQGAVEVEYRNCIFSNNGSGGNMTARELSANALEGFSIVSLGHNVLDDTPTGNAAHPAATGDLRDTDPKLQPLANNGGPTPNHLLFEDSPAIDIGLSSSDFPNDQRGEGFPRIFNNSIDAGAIEIQPLRLRVTTLEDELDSPAGNDLSLREAIRDAAPGSSITFAPGLDGGTIQLDATRGALLIDKPLSINASALPEGIIIDGGSNDDLVLNANETRCLIINDEDFETSHPVTLTHLTIQNGVVESEIFNDGPGGIPLAECSPSRNAIFRAGANISNREALTLIDCQILNGTALLTEKDEPAPSDGSEVEVNGAFGGGGGLFSSGGTLTARDCQFSENYSDLNGGGLLLNNTLTTLQSCQIEINSSQGSGAGIHVSRNLLTISDSTIADNSALQQFSDGGGIATNGADINITRSTLSGNFAQRFGGVLQNFFGETITLTQCTLSGNSAGERGGVMNIRFATVDLIHCTLVNNSAPQTGGIFAFANGGSINDEPITLTASIVRDNPGGDLDFSGPNIIFSGGNNLVGTGRGTNRFSPEEINTFPLFLGPLADNGGPTQTHLPFSNSFVVNGATESDLTTDQRNFPIIDTPDIGAAEFQSTPTPFPFGDDDSDGLSFILELALGTNPDVADFTNPRRPRIDLDENGKIAFTFGRGSEPLPGTAIIVERSTTLAADSFEEVYRFVFNSETSTTGTGIMEDLMEDQFLITDDVQAEGRAFYRLDVTLLPD